jgi:hypothetical protein
MELAEKLSGTGRSTLAIVGRRAKSNKPANMKQAATRIAIEMRRIIVFLSNQSRSFYYNSVSLPDPLAALEAHSSIQSHRSENSL